MKSDLVQIQEKHILVKAVIMYSIHMYLAIINTKEWSGSIQIGYGSTC